MAKRIIVLKEHSKGERRVALDPDTANRFSDHGFSVTITTDAGLGAFHANDQYTKCHIESSPQFEEGDIILTVQPPTLEQIKEFKPGSWVVGLLNPFQNLDKIQAMCDAKINSIALEFIPRITRAQSMDALSSQASIVGYQGALMAASYAPRFFPMLTTAAGTIRPARVIVIGAGVAGLQAIATARRIGAEVEAYDIRAAAKGDVESLGAKLIDTGVDASSAGGYARELTPEEIQKQEDALSAHLAHAHAVICTAGVPGRRSPLIIKESMIDAMPAGAVIMDLVAESGGNCELTQPDEVVKKGDVTIYGPTNIASDCAIHASEMYAHNIYNLLAPFINKEEEELILDIEEEIIEAATITYDGKIRSQRIKTAMEEK